MILGVDPGTTESGYALIGADWRDAGPTQAGVIDNRQMLKHITRYHLEHGASVAIEMVSSYGARVGQTTFDTVVWIGRMVQLCESHGIRYRLIKRHEVKKQIAPGQKSNDAVIRRKMIEAMAWSDEETRANAKRLCLKSHAWQALAVAASLEIIDAKRCGLQLEYV